MKKNILTTIVLVFGMHLGYSQLQVINNGNVGIGTTTPVLKLEVNGQSRFDDNLFINNGPNQIRFVPNSGGDAEMGSSTGILTFYHTQGGVNTLVAHAFVKFSDRRLKQNINPLVNSLTIINQLNGVSFQYRKLDTLGHPTDVGADTAYGFIADDVQPVLPHLVTTNMGYLSMDYSGIIPFLVEGIKAQQKTIDSLRTKTNQIDSIKDVLTELTNSVNSCCSNNNARIAQPGMNNIGSTTTIVTQDVKLTNFDAIILNQNVPNPFAEQTTISYNIPQNAGTAQLLFYDVNGRQIQNVNINTKGAGQLNVYANDLTNGVYSYTLVVDGKIIDTKRMIKQQ